MSISVSVTALPVSSTEQEEWPGWRSSQIQAILRLALEEDIGRGDVTSEATVPAGSVARAELWQKASGVVCGLPLVREIYAALDPGVTVQLLVPEGSWGERRVVAAVSGPACSVLSGERTAVNFVQRLSGIATASRRAADAVAGTGLTVLDTRKTTPGLRVLEKYAVRAGGCRNHRAGLDDGVLIKENHIRAAGGITTAVRAARSRVSPLTRIEVEVTTLRELDEAVAAGADLVLYDNGSISDLQAAVARAAGRVPLEASGGITLADLPAVARTGVTYVSLGALTHSAGVLDFSLEVQ